MTRRTVIFVFAALVIAILSIGLGESLGERTMLKGVRKQLDGVQAMLLVNRIGDERKIKSLLARGCASAAAIEVDHSENSDMKLLAEFLNGKLDQPTIRYIANQDPNLLKELKKFKSKYGNPWQEPECKK